MMPDTRYWIQDAACWLFMEFALFIKHDLVSSIRYLASKK